MPHRGRAPAEHDRQEIGQGAEQHLRHEPDGERGHHQPEVVVHAGDWVDVRLLDELEVRSARLQDGGAEDDLSLEERAQQHGRSRRQAENCHGGLRTAVRTRGISRVTVPAAYRTSPAATTQVSPRTDPATVTTIAPSRIGSTAAKVRSEPSSRRVRSMVGHSVTSVPRMVSPTNPSRLRARCARTSRDCHSSERPAAMNAPSAAPTSSPLVRPRGPS